MRTSSLLFKARQPLDFRSAALFADRFFRLSAQADCRWPFLVVRLSWLDGLAYGLSAFQPVFWQLSGLHPGSFYAWMTCRMEYKNRFVFCDVFFWLKLFFFLKKVFYVEESFLEKPFSRNMNVKPAD